MLYIFFKISSGAHFWPGKATVCKLVKLIFGNFTLQLSSTIHLCKDSIMKTEISFIPQIPEKCPHNPIMRAKSSRNSWFCMRAHEICKLTRLTHMLSILVFYCLWTQIRNTYLIRVFASTYHSILSSHDLSRPRGNGNYRGDSSSVHAVSLWRFPRER